jgi:heme-degrading monooxygenase HmoA
VVRNRPHEAARERDGLVARRVDDRADLARLEEERGRERVRRVSDADGIKEYRATTGNRAAYILRREDGERVEFVTLSFWDSLDAVRAFAGEDVERAVFYPEDDRFLVERETVATNYEAIETSSG